MKPVALIPAYNEEKTIKKVISEVKQIGLIPVIVDDGSTDRTYEIVKKMNVLVVKHGENKGKGEALNTGFKYVLKNFPSVEFVVMIDADMQYSPRESIKLLKPLESGEADFIMGFRQWKNVPYANRIGNFGWKVLFNLFFSTDLRDTNCGFIALNKKAIKKIGKVYGGYIIENSMLIHAIKKKLRVKQVPVNVRYSGRRRIPKFARMFFGILTFILIRGLKYRLSKI